MAQSAGDGVPARAKEDEPSSSSRPNAPLRLRRWLDDDEGPVAGASVIPLSTFRSREGHLLANTGDGAMWTANPPLDLGPPSKRPASPIEEAPAAPPTRRGNRLEVSLPALGDQGVRDLLASPRLESLEELSLRDCGIGPAGVEALVSARHLVHIRRLSLSGNPVGDAGARTLAAASHWRFLARLDLSQCGVGLAAARDLLYAARFHYLESLDLTGNDFGSGDVELLDGGRSSDLIRRLRRRICTVTFSERGRVRTVKTRR